MISRNDPLSDEPDPAHLKASRIRTLDQPIKGLVYVHDAKHRPFSIAGSAGDPSDPDRYMQPTPQKAGRHGNVYTKSLGWAESHKAALRKGVTQLRDEVVHDAQSVKESVKETLEEVGLSGGDAKTKTD